jgi:hypothetical protein
MGLGGSTALWSPESYRTGTLHTSSRPPATISSLDGHLFKSEFLFHRSGERFRSLTAAYLIELHDKKDDDSKRNLRCFLGSCGLINLFHFHICAFKKRQEKKGISQSDD